MLDYATIVMKYVCSVYTYMYTLTIKVNCKASNLSLIDLLSACCFSEELATLYSSPSNMQARLKFTQKAIVKAIILIALKDLFQLHIYTYIALHGLCNNLQQNLLNTSIFNKQDESCSLTAGVTQHQSSYV